MWPFILSSWVFDLTISRNKREGIWVVLAWCHVVDFGLVVVVVSAAALAAVVTVAGQRILTGSLTLLLAVKEKMGFKQGVAESISKNTLNNSMMVFKGALKPQFFACLCKQPLNGL